MLFVQEQCGDSQLSTNQMWDEDTSALDMLAANVLLFIKNEQPCPRISTESMDLTTSSPLMKRKLFKTEGDLKNFAADQSVKRMKRSESEDEDSFVSDEWSSHQRSARISRSHSQEFDSEFEYENQPHGEDEEEDEYNLEEEDDEWSDGRLMNHLSMLNSSPVGRIPRKKAPSGTACEKHKRWKKRCPEDCPMRKGKKRSAPRSQDMSPKDETYYQWSMDQMSTEGQLSPRSDSMMDGFSSADSNLGANDSDQDLKNLNKRKSSPKVLRRSSSIDEDFMVDDSPKGKSSKKMSAAKRSRGTRKYLPQACDRHKMLHAKCPANCPDRLARDAEGTRKTPEFTL